MKQFVYAALIGASMAADEFLSGSVACEAGKQTVVSYDDKDCANQSADQTTAEAIAGYMSSDDYAYTDYSCHKDAAITSNKADAATNPGKQIGVSPWGQCGAAGEYFYIMTTTATYGGDDKKDPCDFNDDFKVTVYDDADCKTENAEVTTQAAAGIGENDSQGWYTYFCTDESVTDGSGNSFEWGKCTQHPSATDYYLIYEASNKLMNVAASAMAAAVAFYLY